MSEQFSFAVIDTKNEELPNLDEIKTESWTTKAFDGSTDFDGPTDFAILPDGKLILIDDCGHYAECPTGRFRVTLYVPI